MKKTAGIATLAGILATTFAGPVEAAVIFRGVLIFTSANDCVVDRTGFGFNARYHLSNLGDNPNYTGLSLFDRIGAESYFTTSGRFQSTFAPVSGASIYNIGVLYDAKLRLTSSDPPNNQITPRTEFIEIKGVIEGPDGDPGVGGNECRAAFRASFTRRIE